jgi:hypothetical protein
MAGETARPAGPGATGAASRVSGGGGGAVCAAGGSGGLAGVSGSTSSSSRSALCVECISHAPAQRSAQGERTVAALGGAGRRCMDGVLVGFERSMWLSLSLTVVVVVDESAARCFAPVARSVGRGSLLRRAEKQTRTLGQRVSQVGFAPSGLSSRAREQAGAVRRGCKLATLRTCLVGRTSLP